MQNPETEAANYRCFSLRHTSIHFRPTRHPGPRSSSPFTTTHKDEHSDIGSIISAGRAVPARRVHRLDSWEQANLGPYVAVAVGRPQRACADDPVIFRSDRFSTYSVSRRWNTRNCWARNSSWRSPSTRSLSLSRVCFGSRMSRARRRSRKSVSSQTKRMA